MMVITVPISLGIIVKTVGRTACLMVRAGKTPVFLPLMQLQSLQSYGSLP